MQTAVFGVKVTFRTSCLHFSGENCLSLTVKVSFAGDGNLRVN